MEDMSLNTLNIEEDGMKADDVEVEALQ